MAISSSAECKASDRLRLPERIRAHIAIARPDHLVKNVFVLPGMIIPLTLGGATFDSQLIYRICIGAVAVSLITCSNYVINEVLDAPYDRHHPVKKHRPVPSGLVSITGAYVQWVAMMVAGIALGVLVSGRFTVSLAALWVMGIIYNVPPLRTKDIVVMDVLSEAINNPLRMLLGWQLVAKQMVPPASLLISYWMIGCYFMALKRFSEYRENVASGWLASYRKSLSMYSERLLMGNITFYASAAMMFFGAFIMRYRMELVLSFPLVAVVMAVYLDLAFESGSAVQNPEQLHRSGKLMTAVVVCTAVMIALLLVDLPGFRKAFDPTTAWGVGIP